MSEENIDYTDKETLKRLYIDEGKSQREIGEMAGVHTTTIGYHMRKHEIETRDAADYEPTDVQLHATYCTVLPWGYEKWHAWDSRTGEKEIVSVHRLLAVAEYGLDAVVGKDVHHENGIPWDNRPENITPMSRREHTAHHHRGENAQKAKLTESDVKEIRDKLKHTDMEHKEIASEYDVSANAISNIKTGRTWGYVE